jgi:hypothetical protein
MAPPRYYNPPNQGQQLQQLLQALAILRMLEEQQAAAQKKEEGGGKNVSATIQKAKQVYDLYKTGKGAYDDISAAIAANSTSSGLGAAGGMSTMGSSAPASTGFSGIEEMVGNGLYSEAPGSMMQTPAESGTTWGDIAPYLNAAISAYNAYRTLNNKNMEQDQKNLALAASAAQASTPWTKGYGSLAAGALQAGSALAGKGTEEEKTQAAAHAAGMAAANYWTAGLAGLADGYARDQWGGTMKKIDKFRFNTPGTPEWALMKVAGIWDTDKWKTEGNRLRELEKKGIAIPESMKLPMMLKRGRTKDELINKNVAQDFIGYDPEGTWTNNKFANSRDENDLRKEDIWGYAAFSEKFGNDWWNKFNTQQRSDIAQAVIDNKAVNEHHGTVDINWTPELDAAVGKITASTSIPTAQAQQQQQIQRPGRGQVARVSPGMYMNDRGQMVRSGSSQGAMKNSYQIPRTGRK